MTKDEKAEATAMFNDMRAIFQPPTREISLGEVVEKFCSLENHRELIDAFSDKYWGRNEFCSRFKCRKWVYDFLDDMARRNRARSILEKELSKLNHSAKSKKSSAPKTAEVERPLRKEDFDVPTMMVVVNRWNPTNPNGQSLYDAARGYWYVGASGKAYKCRYVVASYYGRVMEVYEIDHSKSWMNWKQSPKKTNPDDRPISHMRRAFEGTVAPNEVRFRYLGKSTSGLILPRAEKVYLGFK